MEEGKRKKNMLHSFFLLKVLKKLALVIHLEFI